MEKWIWLDMDGTFANLYGVEGWLDDLIAENVRPYAQAEPMYPMLDLLETLLLLKADKGYKIGVISWLSRQGTENYNRAVTMTKKDWLINFGMDLVLDKILITPYGVRKADTCRPYGMGTLVDDEQRNRDEWDLGNTIDANENIIKKLRELLDK